MKKLLTALLLMAGLATSATQAQVTPPDGATAPETSTADSPKWYAMMSSHMSEDARKNRWLYYDGSVMATEQYAGGLDPSAVDITQYAWRLEDNGDGTCKLVHYTGLEAYVPASATAAAGGNTAVVMQQEGTRWEVMTAASTGLSSQTAANQYVLDDADYTGTHAHAFLNVMADSQADLAFHLTIYESGVQNSSGWFFVPLDIESGGGEGPYTFTYEVEGAELGEISIMTMDTYDEVTSGDTFEAGTEIGVNILYENCNLEVYVNGEESDIDSYLMEQGLYFRTFTLDSDIDLDIRLTQGESGEYTLTYTIEGAEHGYIGISDGDNFSDLASGTQLPAGKRVVVQVEYYDCDLEIDVNGVPSDVDSYLIEQGLYFRTFTMTEDLDLAIRLTQGESSEYTLTYTVEGAELGSVRVMDGNSYADLASGTQLSSGSQVIVEVEYDNSTLEVGVNGVPSDIDSYLIGEGLYFRTFTMNSDLDLAIRLVENSGGGGEEETYTLTTEATNATIRVRDYNTLDDYESGAQLAAGTRLLISATADEGCQLESLTVNGEEWNYWDSYTVESDVHVVATATRLDAHTVNYSLTGSEYGSVRVFNSSNNSDIASGEQVSAGTVITVAVTMNDGVEGTIDVNGEQTTFDSETYEGYYYQRVTVDSDLDIAIELREAAQPSTYYTVSYTVEGGTLGEVTVYDATTWEMVASGDQIAEGHQLGISILFSEGVSGSVTVNGGTPETFDYESCSGYYDSRMAVDSDLDIAIVLESTTGITATGTEGLGAWPTLVDETVNVSMPAAGKVAVYDMAGAQVYAGKLPQGVTTLPLGHLTAGNYLLRLESAGQQQTVRIVKR